MPRWVATVPNIDMQAIFLCGESVVVGSQRETACLDRETGAVVWRLYCQRAASVLTPAGLARMRPDGEVELFDVASGQRRFSRKLEPRKPSGAAGAVVHVPGLPKLLTLAEGDRQITALDLVSGEIRWRHTARRPCRVPNAPGGKAAAGRRGESTLFALDVTNGEVVWRVRDRLPFSGETTVDQESVFALSGGTGGARLHHLDPWTGESRWVAEIDERPVGGRAPMVTREAVVVATRDHRGVGVRAFRRADGAAIWQHEPGMFSPTTAWLSVDDAILVNSDAGTFSCLDGATGETRYHHVFSRSVEADQPRRLEPVLRSGALFVPQHEIHVVRPRDGEVIGRFRRTSSETRFALMKSAMSTLRRKAGTSRPSAFDQSSRWCGFRPVTPGSGGLTGGLGFEPEQCRFHLACVAESVPRQWRHRFD